MNKLSYLLSTAVAVGLVAGVAATPAAAKTQLTVYSTLQKEVLTPYEQAFEAAHPDIDITWVRDAGGVIHARLLAERDNVRADVLFGVPVTNIVSLARDGLIEPYAPKDYMKLQPMFRDKNNPPYWTGLEMYLNIVCFNTVEAEKRGLPKPKTWADLANPIYKGQIAMPNPTMSNTGYGYVHSWIQKMGEDKAWAFLDKLHDNVSVYTNSSSTPCKYAATGEYAIGLSTDLTGPFLKTKGAPIDLLVPSDETAWDIESTAMVKGSKNPEAAKILIDWGASREAHQLFNKYYGAVGMDDLNNGPPNSIPNGGSKAQDYSVEWSIDNRTRILTEWAKRYDSKSEPKSN
ncbi:extracellular solute-binding protein family 1 [Ancylobacter novellus DSM 506]|uniref:Extracellular solute-binding protein family 1 n=1 Tax=Ancylobacter novellus (strain ATCC 8093 / DSM 506 / JCM 20403 / CCM 1077 / IAM 12100 / NBRC 12443 / NCIMB 10456) TaxID=639283 RepID=D7AA06_ANCN5|nr:extracellular solute-binding protein [Ancylobacter novellus]ADH90793.1 extracellular solute-binding protein family 1 [Ancylobacter novellus DSM 506]